MSVGLRFGIGPLRFYVPLSGSGSRTRYKRCHICGYRHRFGYHGLLSDGWHCEHVHQRESTAIDCANKEQRRRQRNTPRPPQEPPHIEEASKEPLTIKAFVRFASVAIDDDLEEGVEKLMNEMEPGTGLIIVSDDNPTYIVRTYDGDWEVLDKIPGSESVNYMNTKIPIHEFNDGDCVELTINF